MVIAPGRVLPWPARDAVSVASIDEPPTSCFFRRRPLPVRVVGDRVVVARPQGGSAIVLDPTAAVVWTALERWRDSAGLQTVLAAYYPGVSERERAEALDALLRLLLDEGLLERSTP